MLLQLQPAAQKILSTRFSWKGKNADALGVVAIIALFLLTHHRLKATIDNCLTTENSADCNFSPESFLSLEKFEIAFVNDYDDDL